jgi:hypothetical protein
VTSSTIIAMELGITLIVVVGWGFWELWKLKKGK